MSIRNKYGRFVYCISTLCAVALFAFASCSQNELYTTDEGKVENKVKITMRNVQPTIMDNIALYAFNDRNSYISTPSLTRLVDTIYTSLKMQTWNLYLLSCENENIIQNNYFKLPITGIDINSMKMWETGTLSGDTLLDKTPEILYDTIANVVIGQGITKRQATMTRNVAKIQVILEYSGFDVNQITNNAFAMDRFVELSSVPTTLAWNGGLYPDKITPIVSAKPLRQYVNFDILNKADTLNFIIPAHRGVDALSVSPSDTTLQKLKIKACLPLNGKRFYGRDSNPIEVPFVPKMNRILQIKLNLSGKTDTKLDIKVTVKDWGNYIDQTDVFN